MRRLSGGVKDVECHAVGICQLHCDVLVGVDRFELVDDFISAITVLCETRESDFLLAVSTVQDYLCAGGNDLIRNAEVEVQSELAAECDVNGVYSVGGVFRLRELRAFARKYRCYCTGSNAYKQLYGCPLYKSIKKPL